jgi:hypothetical protein
MSMKNTLIILVTMALFAPVRFGVGWSAEPSPSIQTIADKYEWTGEFVNVDSSARVMTVKTQVVGTAGASEFQHFKPGDRIVLTWWGYYNYGNGIKSAMLYSASKRLEAREYTLPVEFISYDPTHREVTFKAFVPTGIVEALKSMKAGEWIRATSLHHPTDEQSAIVDVRPYVGSNFKG